MPTFKEFLNEKVDKSFIEKVVKYINSKYKNIEAEAVVMYGGENRVEFQFKSNITESEEEKFKDKLIQDLKKHFSKNMEIISQWLGKSESWFDNNNTTYYISFE